MKNKEAKIIELYRSNDWERFIVMYVSGMKYDSSEWNYDVCTWVFEDRGACESNWIKHLNGEIKISTKEFIDAYNVMKSTLYP